MSKAIDGAILFIGILMVIGGGVLAFERGAIEQGQYQRVIGDYALNAADAPTFQQSILFLQKFNDSMNKEGLTADMYNTPWSWEQTPQNSMQFQYSYVGQMIDRANYYINYTTAQHAGTLTDVYNTALTNFRNEMSHNGPLDWVAQNAWMLHKGYYWNYWYAGALISPGLIIVLVGGVIAFGDDEDD
jgi:hypothetical protein